jgi:hypothetical protein
MTFPGIESVRGGAYLTLDEHVKVSSRTDVEARSAEFVFFGPVEVSLDMPRPAIERCRDLFVAALAEIDADQKAAGQA